MKSDKPIAIRYFISFCTLIIKYFQTGSEADIVCEYSMPDQSHFASKKSCVRMTLDSSTICHK